LRCARRREVFSRRPSCARLLTARFRGTVTALQMKKGG
jgi:hypothetical protein